MSVRRRKVSASDGGRSISRHGDARVPVASLNANPQAACAIVDAQDPHSRQYRPLNSLELSMHPLERLLVVPVSVGPSSRWIDHSSQLWG